MDSLAKGRARGRFPANTQQELSPAVRWHWLWPQHRSHTAADCRYLLPAVPDAGRNQPVLRPIRFLYHLREMRAFLLAPDMLLGDDRAAVINRDATLQVIGCNLRMERSEEHT